MAFINEQLDGIRVLLHQKWEQQRGRKDQWGFETPPRPTISVYEILEKDWGKELSWEDAVILMQDGLNSGGWYVSRRPIPS